MNKLFFIVSFLLLVGCSADDIAVDPSNNISDDNASALDESINATAGDASISLSIDPESLQIKEFCSSPDICKFRQRCGGSKVVIRNDSEYDIKLMSITVKKLNSRGDLDREMTSDLVSKNIIINANSEKVMTARNKCSCKKGNYLCSEEYPHTASPFVVGKTERVVMRYSANNDIFEKVTEATYSIVR